MCHQLTDYTKTACFVCFLQMRKTKRTLWRFITRSIIPITLTLRNLNKRPAIEKLRLSKAFLIPDSSGEFEWTATVINLNHEDNSDLLERCRPLYEYTTFISRIQNYKNQGLTIETAVDIAVDECIRDGILVDFLTAHRTEVLQLFLEELDEQFFINGVKEEVLQEERQRQQEKLKEKIKRKIAKGLSLEQTAEELEEDVETIRPYYEELIA